MFRRSGIRGAGLTRGLRRAVPLPPRASLRSGSFKFSRGVLKILKLFLEMSDDTGGRSGKTIPRRGECVPKIVERRPGR